MNGWLEALLRHRVLFVAGKGGTGRSTISAALALIAARAGRRVLAVDVDAQGDLSSCLGAAPAGFRPAVTQHNLSVLSLRTDESFQEYLNLYFKIPRLARLTPLARVFDFIATGVPGPRDLLVVGKIAYEERRTERSGDRTWDLIVVDCAAGGQVEAHLAAARAMLTLVRGGVIRRQVEWVESLVSDASRSAVVLCALPQEMPVVEAIELHERIGSTSGASVDLCVLNRAMTAPVTHAQRRLVGAMCADDFSERVAERMGGDPNALQAALDIAGWLHESTVRYTRQLSRALPVPVVSVPLVVARPGLATTRAVATALGDAVP